MKALALVKKVAGLRASLRERGGGKMASAGRLVALRVVQATTVAARQMQSLPIPTPRAAERVVLSTAAAQLRAMADVAELGSAGSADPEIEEALAKLVAETLALVEKVLSGAPEIAATEAPRALGAGTETPREPPKKVSF